MRLAVIVTPQAQHDAVTGWQTDAEGSRELAVSVRAVPEKGRATKAVCTVIAKSIGVSKSRVMCVRGGISRHKYIEIDCTPELFDAWVVGIRCAR